MRVASALGWTWVAFGILLPVFDCRGDWQLAEKGRAACVVVQQAGATEAEQNAAGELAAILSQISGAKFKVLREPDRVSRRAILIGPGPLAAKYFPEVDFSKLGAEDLIMRVSGDKLLLAGGRPRGTMYAVNRFLQEQCGVRWWAPWATQVTYRRQLSVPDLHVHERPAFEYRAPYWSSGFEPRWKAHNGANDAFSKIPPGLGGCIQYKGHAHTFYALVPPDKYFSGHPEWFSQVKGRRTFTRAQLCLTNPKLRDFVVERVKQWLREAPEAGIVSLTQNDWQGWCECDACKALDDAEGSHSGTMMSFVNYVAERIEPEFPNVALDTFAYQYTRKPPKTVRPRANVIVRLCSIECNFREPLDHPSNREFMDDLEKWSKICSRLYIWDYVTDFRNYVHPHPNWFTLGPNVRLFNQFGVKGVFEEGAYAGPGAEMAELRAWLLAQMLWNPKQNDEALIREFLAGYYGEAAARPIWGYLGLMRDSSEGVVLPCFLPARPMPHLTFAVLCRAERLWQEAERGASWDPEKLLRVKMSHLPVRYALLKSWTQLRNECWEQNGTWPFSDSRKAVAEEFRRVCEGVPGKGWTQVRVLNESGLTVADFLKKNGDDVAETIRPTPPVRLKEPAKPPGLTGTDPAACVDLQDNVARLYQPGRYAEILPDMAASDLRAVRMPGDNGEWAFRIEGVKLPAKVRGKTWKIYAVVRVEKTADCTPDTAAFSAGIYDMRTKKVLAEFKGLAGQAGSEYRSFLLGTEELGPDRDIWVAPARGPGVEAVWVDRVFLTPVSGVHR